MRTERVCRPSPRLTASWMSQARIGPGISQSGGRYTRAAGRALSRHETCGPPRTAAVLTSTQALERTMIPMGDRQANPMGSQTRNSTGQASTLSRRLMVVLDPPDLYRVKDPLDCYLRVTAHSAVLKAATLVGESVNVYSPPGSRTASMHAALPWKTKYSSGLPARLVEVCRDVETLVRHWEPILSYAFLDRAGVLLGSNSEVTDDTGLAPTAIGRLLKRARPAWSPADFWGKRIGELLSKEVIEALPPPVDVSWLVEDLLALSQLVYAQPGTAVLDRWSSDVIDAALAAGWAWSGMPQWDPARAALAAAPAYVLRVLPGVTQYPAELVLEWRDELADSLSSFRSRIQDFGSNAELSSDADQASRQLEVIGAHLDHDLAELRREARATRLWRATLDQLPTIAGRGATVGIAFGTGFRDPSVGLVSLLSASIAQGVTMAFDVARRRRAIRSHPMQWRYAIEVQTWPALEAQHGLSRRHPTPESRALFELYDIPPIFLPRRRRIDDGARSRLLSTWPSEEEWADVAVWTRDLKANQVAVLDVFAQMELDSMRQNAVIDAAISLPIDDFDRERDQLEDREMLGSHPDTDMPGNVIVQLTDRGLSAARLLTAGGVPPIYVAKRVAELRDLLASVREANHDESAHTDRS